MPKILFLMISLFLIVIFSGCRQAAHTLNIHPIERTLASRYGASFFTHDPYFYGIENSEFGDDDLADAVCLLNLASINKLTFKQSSLTDDSIASFLKVRRLAQVNISGSASITDEWMRGLHGNETIWMINVIGTKVTPTEALLLLRKSNIEIIYGGNRDGYRMTIYDRSSNHPDARIDWRFESESEYREWLANQDNVVPK